MSIGIDIDAGLTVFVAVLVANSGGLLFDLALWFFGFATITDLVRATPLLGVPIILLQLIGVAGLASHFYCES